jgi:hypothetical protein
MKAKLLFLVFLLGVSLQSLAQINITTQPVPNVTVCEGGTLTLSVEATGIGLTYQWYYGTVIIPLAFYPTYTSSPVTIAEAGLYNCTISSPVSPSVTSSNAIVTVNPAPTIAPIAPISACDSYTLPPYNDSMFVTTGAIVTHYYRMPGGPTVPGNIERYPGELVTATTTLYPYNNQIGNSCWSNAPWQININQAPNIITPLLLPVYNVMLGQSLSLSVVATGANLTYQWYHGGTPITLGNNPSALTATLTIAPATLMDNGNYTCQVTNLDGCGQVTTSTQVIVNPLSVVENSRVDFSVYPNPASNMVTVQYSNVSNTTATIAVYDLQGKQVLQQEATIENNQSRFSIASLQSGLYLIKITTAEATVTKKLMVN